ncbi:metal ABC transporter solute-binding protein, Zn/Mn family [Arhodomonas sp. AD133]|uniref:metal ABC transporter solute-binding protein, Zn/Mn family n=1 Tax=Arhodomonas sp. AD133 TaxID=3415009 RepID=UPI003EC0DBA8
MKRLLLVLAFVFPVAGYAEPLPVFVSVLPMKTFVEEIGGEHVTVRALVGAGYSPATYEPTPRQLEALSRARLYVRTGVAFEDAWMPRISGANPDMRVLDAREGIDLRGMEAHTHGDHSHGRHAHERSHDHRDHGDHEGHDHATRLPGDPHVWTSPRLVKRMSRRIRDVLVELDPAHREAYHRRYDAYAAELEALDADIRQLLAGREGGRFMVYHPAWGYFADAYGLVQVPIEHEGKEPGPRALTALIDQAQRENVRVIFVQQQFSERSAERVAAAIDGRVVAIDPLAADYTANMRRVARLIADAIPQ